MTRRSADLAFASLAVALLATPVAWANHVQTGSGRVVAFDHKAGNEWWVEVVLSGQDDGQVSQVHARDDGGPWVALQLRSWGAWAASFHVEPGHRVQFRATWSGGAMQDSCWFTHPAGTEQCAPPFDADFRDVRGNEWWIQVQVVASAGPMVSVDVRLDDGAWRPLAKQSWGSGHWAASYRILDATKVQLRATDGGGNTDLSPCYRWIPAEGQPAAETPCSPPPGFTATFYNVKGNDWWVEVRVTGTRPVSGVDARLGCSDTWNPLTLRSWGAWAASFRVFPGTHVDFRARSTTGATDLSDAAYVWPDAMPTDACDHPWPRASSFADVRFRSQDEWDDVDGHHAVTIDGLVHTRWTGTTWDGTCELRRGHQVNGGAWTFVNEHYEWDHAPPMGQLPAPVGSPATAQTVEGCALVTRPDQPVTEHQTRTFSLRTSSGDPIPIAAIHAESSGPTHSDSLWWDQEHGLMLQWTLATVGGSNSHRVEGWLLNTDAAFGS